jgi:hypothetical protein
VLLQPETLVRLFEEQGFRCTIRETDDEYHYRRKASPLHQVIYTPYELASLRHSIGGGYQQRGARMLFEYQAEAAVATRPNRKRSA